MIQEPKCIDQLFSDKHVLGESHNTPELSIPIKARSWNYKSVVRKKHQTSWDISELLKGETPKTPAEHRQAQTFPGAT